MPLNDIKKPASILAAVDEYRRLGKEAFLSRYGFRSSRDYFLVIDGERFDSKAIVGAAHGYEFPSQGPLRWRDFTGGAVTVERKLVELGFKIDYGTDSPLNRASVEADVPVSALLKSGSLYTREDLKKLLDTQDATINTGIFKPAGFASVLIFITKNKTSDRTQYEDRLDGDTLYCQGQSAGRTDVLLSGHRQRGLELLVFYRDSKYEHPGAGFRFEGRFDYVSHSGTKPANFVLHRISTGLDQAAAEAESAGAFDPANIGDARKKTLAAIVRRQGQPAFRRALLAAYGGCCAVTGTATAEVLEAAHIVPYQGPETNQVSNGLLLRADLHTLFDLGLIAVNEATFELIISTRLQGTDYAKWAGRRLRLPSAIGERPSIAAICAHRQSWGL